MELEIQDKAFKRIQTDSAQLAAKKKPFEKQAALAQEVLRAGFQMPKGRE